MTYGWAILVVVTAISALGYFGILSPSGLANFLPEFCAIDSGITCLDHSVEFVSGEWGEPDSNDLNLVVKNNFGVDYEIIEIRVLDEVGRMKVGTTAFLDKQTKTVFVDDITNASASYKPAYPKGTRYQKEFIITVRNVETQLEHHYKGYVRGKVD